MRGRSTIVIILTFLAGACGAIDDTDQPDGGFMTSCTRTNECNAGFVCIAGTCGSPGTILENRPCSAARDCQSGFYCNLQQRCDTPSTAGTVGAACLTDDNCTPGLRCVYGGFTGTCEQGGQTEVGDSCTSSNQCLAGTYCGPASGQCSIFATAFPRYQGTACPEDTGPFKAYHDVPTSTAPIADFFRLPYPNDIRVTSSGGRKIVDLADFPRPGPTPLGVDLVDLYVDALTEDFDGFGANMPISFRFSQDLDFGHLDSTALDTIRIFDVTDNRGLLSIGYSYTPNKSLFACRYFLSVYPGYNESPYKANHTYLIVMKRSGLRAQAGGATAEQDADLGVLLAAARPTDDDVMMRAWDTYAPVRKYIADNGIAPADVGTATVFTIGDTTGHMQRLAAATAAEPAPVISELHLCNSGTGTDPCGDGTSARACPETAHEAFHEIHGKIRMPIYQMGTAPYERPSDGGGLNEPAGGGAVTKVRDEEVCFALTLPKTTAPAAGWPLVVYEHGTGGSFRSFINDGLAAQLATASTRSAVMSFDLVGHGARRGASTKDPEELVFNVLNPRAARDNFLQGAAEILHALRLPAAAVPGGWTGPTIKFSGKPLFFGHSQGATHGELALPFTSEAPAAVLSGAGANLVLSLLNKTSPISVPEGLQFLLGEVLDGSHPMIAIWSNYFDRSDPVNFNRLIVTNPVAGRSPKHVFMSWGEGDTFSPRATLEANAIMLGAPVVAPALYKSDPMPGPVQRPVRLNLAAPGGNVTAGVFQYNPDGYDGHFVAWRNPTALADVTAFITSFFATGVPNVP